MLKIYNQFHVNFVPFEKQFMRLSKSNQFNKFSFKKPIEKAFFQLGISPEISRRKSIKSMLILAPIDENVII